ncbi:MAG: ParB/RepB/Spo0J family partition protein [Candidatus Paceibacterota bacterium]|jgi:ParB family chromosome partitioning protein
MLGKGLESLIPKKHQQPSDNNGGAVSDKEDVLEETIISKTIEQIPTISGPIFHIEVEKIVLNPYQPRKEFNQEALNELASSIREFGILQPLVVSKTEEVGDFGTKITYQLIAGQRRLMAAKILGLATIPAVVKSDLKKTDALEMAIVENVQRADLNILETARAYSRLSEEFGMTQREIAARLGKSRESVANAMRLLSLPSEIQEALMKGKINESQARLILQIQEPQKQMEIFFQIITNNLSARDIKKHINQLKEHDQKGDVMRTEDIEMKNMEKMLSEFLGAPVNVEFSRNGGKIIIHFYSPEEAMGIAQRIKPEE